VQTKIGDSGPGPAGGGVSGIASVVGPPGRGQTGGVAWGSAADHRSLYVAVSGLLAQPANTSGSLTALDMTTGVARWHTAAPEPACSWGERNCSHATGAGGHVMPGSAFSGSMDGHLRAYPPSTARSCGLRHGKGLSNQERYQGERRPLDHGGATIVNGWCTSIRATPCSPSRSMEIGLEQHTYIFQADWVDQLLLLLSFHAAVVPRARPVRKRIARRPLRIRCEGVATMRYPDPFKPWTKQAPSEVTASGVVIEGRRILTMRTCSLRHPGSDSGECGRDKMPATVVAVAPGIDLAVLQLDDASSSTRIRRWRAPASSRRSRRRVGLWIPTGGNSLSITKDRVRIEFVAYNYPGPACVSKSTPRSIPQ